MKREIKFRGKRFNNGEWGYGFYLKADERHWIIPVDALGESEYMDDWIEVDPETVGEFTGLHDKNGKEIWEADIVKFKKKKLGKTYKASVIFDSELAMFSLSFSDPDHYGTKDLYARNKGCEIIGNIYENPELLK